MNNKILQQKVNRAKLLASTPFKDLKGVSFNNPSLTVEQGMARASRLALKGFENSLQNYIKSNLEFENIKVKRTYYKQKFNIGYAKTNYYRRLR